MDSATAKTNRGQIIANTLNLHVCHFDEPKPSAGITQPGWAVTHPTNVNHPLAMQGIESELKAFKEIDTRSKEIESNPIINGKSAGSISTHHPKTSPQGERHE